MAKRAKKKLVGKTRTTDTRPWTPAQATSRIRNYANDLGFDLWWTDHAKDQLAERGLIIGDALHVLKNGFVYNKPEPATQENHFRYAMECSTPNSGSRTVRVIVIPSPQRTEAKIVTVMWAD